MTPRLASRSGQGDWRTSPFSEKSSDDLAAYRGAAAGLNVVLVILESTGAQYLAPYGAPDDPTPTLSRLARDGILFEHAYAVYPESIKGLFATLCGRPPAFDVDAETHAQIAVRAADAAPRGAADIARRSFTRAGSRISAWRPCSSSSDFDTLADAGDIGGNRQSSFGVDEPAAVEHMLKWIDTLPAGQRFFLAYLPVAGHHPYSAPERRSVSAGDRSRRLQELAPLRRRRPRDVSRRTPPARARSADDVRRRRRSRRGVRPARRQLRPLAVHLRREHPRAAGHPPAGGSAADGRGARRPGRERHRRRAHDPGSCSAWRGPPLHEGVSLLRPRERMALFFTDYCAWAGSACAMDAGSSSSRSSRSGPGSTICAAIRARPRIGRRRRRTASMPIASGSRTGRASRREQVTSSPRRLAVGLSEAGLFLERLDDEPVERVEQILAIGVRAGSIARAS